MNTKVHLSISQELVRKVGHIHKLKPHWGPPDVDPPSADNAHKKNRNSDSYQLPKDAKTASSKTPASSTLSTELP